MRQTELHFHNTIPLEGDELVESEEKALYQDERVLNLFSKMYSATPSVIWKMYCSHYGDCPLTSIRRSITNLTKINKLIQTGNQYKGIYGRLENEWALI